MQCPPSASKNLSSNKLSTTTHSVAEDRDRGVAALAALFRHYMSHPESLPPFYFEEATHSPGDLPRARIVTDYIAGMTDHFLLRTHNELLV